MDLVWIIDNGYLCTGAGEASADVPEGEEDKAKDDNAVAEGIANSFQFLYIFITTITD